MPWPFGSWRMSDRPSRRKRRMIEARSAVTVFLMALGACVAGAHGQGMHDAGIASSGEIASNFVHVDAGMGFGEPVEPPEPRALIDGADSLIGTWVELESDGSPCKPKLAASKPDHLG